MSASHQQISNAACGDCVRFTKKAKLFLHKNNFALIFNLRFDSRIQISHPTEFDAGAMFGSELGEDLWHFVE